MNALQIMSPRSIKIDWDNIEYGWIKLPILFKTFHDTFDINTIRKLHWYHVNGSSGIERFGEYTHPLVKNIILDTIFELNELKNQVTKSLDLEDETDSQTYKDNVIPIAYDSGGALLMLGVGEDNVDKIYYYVRHLDDKLKIIADNIFEFFKDYHIEIDETYLNGKSLDQLYRNWGDKFWSVRE